MMVGIFAELGGRVREKDPGFFNQAEAGQLQPGFDLLDLWVIMVPSFMRPFAVDDG
jgi:hypothetical protein